MSSDSSSSSIIHRTTNTIVLFFALYFTTLFSLDTWAAARGSPYRAPSSNAFYRPANMPPPRDSYQGGMHGRGNAGLDGGDHARRPEGRIPQARDSRPAMPLFGTASCGACMS